MKKQSHPLLIALQQEFAWLEDRDLRVGTIYLNPKEVTTISGLAASDFDMLSPSNRRAFKKNDPQPGINWGTLWGAHVRASSAVPKGHAAIVPDGMILLELEGTACINLGADQAQRKDTKSVLDVTNDRSI